MAEQASLPTPAAEASVPNTPQSQQQHEAPPEGWECLVTYEDITAENYVEYQGYPSLRWRPARMEQSVVEQLLQTQFHTYIERVKKTDCQAELKRLLASGPPIFVSDAQGLPLADKEAEGDNGGSTNDDGTAAASATTTAGDDGTTEDTHIVQLWFASDNQERSAKLDGAVEGPERERLWQELRQFIVVEGTEPGDSDTAVATSATTATNGNS
jgi:hypothetical protein